MPDLHRRKSISLKKRRISCEEKVSSTFCYKDLNESYFSKTHKVNTLFCVQLAEVISQESDLKEQNRKMSSIIIEAEEVNIYSHLRFSTFDIDL